MLGLTEQPCIQQCLCMCLSVCLSVHASTYVPLTANSSNAQVRYVRKSMAATKMATLLLSGQNQKQALSLLESNVKPVV